MGQGREGTMRGCTPFQNLKVQLNEMAKEFKFNPVGRDFFEEFILKIARIKEQPARIEYYSLPSDPNSCYLAMKIDNADVRKKILLLNEKFPDLKINISKNYYNRAALYGDMWDICEFNQEKDLFIKMDAEALQTHILPLLKTYLKDNPEVVKSYQDDSMILHVAVEAIKELLKKEGISWGNEEYTHFLVEFRMYMFVLCHMILDSSIRAQGVTSTLQTLSIPTVLNTIVLDYLNATPFDIEKFKFSEESFTYGGPWFARGDDLTRLDDHNQMRMYLTLESSSIKSFLDFFNRIVYRSAVSELMISKQDEYHIDIKNKVFVNPGFQSLMQDALQIMPLDKLDAYRVYSKTLPETTTEMIKGIDNFADRLSAKYQSEPASHNFVKSLYTLTSFFKLRITSNAPTQAGVYAEVEAINALIRSCMKTFKPFNDFLKIQHKKWSLFTVSLDRDNDALLKSTDEVHLYLERLSAIANKKLGEIIDKQNIKVVVSEEKPTWDMSLRFLRVH